ncbi:MAG: hypothetical protein ACFN4S_02880, partial [Prevotella conceptionensis]
TVFSGKTHCILLQIAPKTGANGGCLNKNSFFRIHQLAPSCINTKPRENRLFATRWAVADKKSTHNVKISTKN